MGYNHPGESRMVSPHQESKRSELYCPTMQSIASSSVHALPYTDSAAYYDRADDCAGAFYGGNGAAVGANFVFILAIIAWVGATCAILFLGIKHTIGIRVDDDMEVSQTGLTLHFSL